ncbi:hypothetical protein Tco_1273979 [Tanacetum coccineum]
METKVETCSVERKYFEIEKKELFIENDLLLEHINFQDVMCIVMLANFENNCVLHANEDNLEYAQMEQSYIYEYSRRVQLEVELSKMKDMVEKDDNLEYAQMEQSYIDEYSRCVELEVELSKMKDIVEKDVYNELSKRSLRLDQHCINLELLVYVSATCPSSLNKNEKLVAITPMNKSKKVRSEEFY